MTLEEYIKEQRERVANMTLAQARQIVANHYGHDDERIECEKAVKMLLDCADEAIQNKVPEKVQRAYEDGKKDGYVSAKVEEIRKESKWIPVTERLPEEDINVLVTIVKCRHKVMYAKYDRQLQKFCVGNYIRSKYVTAWMPLPEPYKEDKQ